MAPVIAPAARKVTRRRRVMGAAQSVVSSEPISAGIFALVALAAFVFALYMGVQASISGDYLTTLRAALAVISLAFACALAYEAASLATHRFPTISSVTDAAFRAHPIIWVTIFGGLMGLVGALALHFTRVAAISSTVAGAQRAFAGAAHPIVWAALLGVAIILVSLLVSRLTPMVVKQAPGDPGFSWWVVLLGITTYGAGTLVAWMTNWRP